MEIPVVTSKGSCRSWKEIVKVWMMEVRDKCQKRGRFGRFIKAQIEMSKC